MCAFMFLIVYVRVYVSSKATRKLELQGKIQLSGPSQEKGSTGGLARRLGRGGLRRGGLGLAGPLVHARP